MFTPINVLASLIFRLVLSKNNSLITTCIAVIRRE